MAKGKSKNKFYGVAVGRKVGVFASWAECEAMVKGYSGARFKGSKTRQEAQAFVDGERKVGEKKPRRTAEDAEQETASKRQRTGDLLVERQVHVHINFDGGSRGNPGLAGAGAVVHVCWSDNGSPDDPVEKTIHLRYFMPGKHTNNAAEYRGLLLGLKAGLREVKQLDVSGVELFPHLVVRGDSRLIIEQLNGNYKCNSKNLQPFYEEVTGLFKEFETLRNFSKALEHVYRERNAVADGLANEAMDARRSWLTTSDDGHATEHNVDGSKRPVFKLGVVRTARRS